MKTILVVRDGKVVEIKDGELNNSKEEAFSIKVIKKPEYLQTRKGKEEYLKRLQQSLNII